MKVQLLLLVALAGPFCAFTSASPTFPTELLSASPEKNEETTNVDSSVLAEISPVVITGPPPTSPEALPEFLSETESATKAAPTIDYTYKAFVFTDRQDVSTKPVTETATDGAQTEAPAVETLAPETSAPDAVTAPEENRDVEGEDHTEGPKMEEELGDIVTDEEESLSSGQIIGIVIGALLAVVIVIAVVIAVVRRMGKYSP